MWSISLACSGKVGNIHRIGLFRDLPGFALKFK